MSLLGIGSLGLGAAQLIGGLFGGPKGDIPQHSISPELQKSYMRGEELAKQGMTAAERAAYNQALNQARQTGFQRSMDTTGGNLAKALSGGLKAQRLGAENQIAIQNAQLRRQNIARADQLAGQMQQQRNFVTQSERDRFLQEEQAAGAAIGGGLTNIVNPLNLNAAMQYGGQGMFTGVGSMLENVVNSGAVGGGISPNLTMSSLNTPNNGIGINPNASGGGVGVQTPQTQIPFGATPSLMPATPVQTGGIGVNPNIGTGTVGLPTPPPTQINFGASPSLAPYSLVPQGMGAGLNYQPNMLGLNPFN